MSVLPPIEQDFVESGQAKIEARPIAILGDESDLAAQAALCAAGQGRFWAYHDVLFANQGPERSGAFKAERLKAFAAAIGLDTASFNSCLDSGTHEAAVESATAAARGSGVQGTPTFIVNGVKTENTTESIRAAVEAVLAGGQ